MKKYLALAVAIMMTIGCLPVISSAAEEITIDFWFWEDNEGQEKAAYEQKWVEYCKDKGISGIKINFEAFSNSSVMHEKLIPALVSGEGPDVFHVTPAWMSELVSMDAAYQLDDAMANWTSFAAGDVGNGILELCKANQGHYYCAPWNIVVLYIYCRTDMFKAAGVDYPTTMENFYEACRSLTKDTDGDGQIDQYGFAMRGASGGHTGWASLVFSADENATYVRDGKAAFNTEAVIEANQKFIDLYREGYCPPSSITDGMQGIQQNFTTGVAAMFIHHVGSYNNVSSTVGEANVKVIPVPIGISGKRFVTSDPSSIVVNANSDNLEAATKFVEFMCEPETVAYRSELLGRFPWQESLLADEKWHSNQGLDISTQCVGESIAPPSTNAAAEWINNLWPQTLQRALMDEITSAEMIQILADGIQ